MKTQSFRRGMAASLSLVMILAAVAGITGCGAQGAGQTASTTSAATTAAAAGETTAAAAASAESTAAAMPADEAGPFSIWIGTDEKKSPEVTVLQQQIKESLGFDFTVTSRQGDLMTALNMKLNSGSLEDMSVIYRDAVAINAYIASGMVLDIEPYLNMPDKYPNLAKMDDRVKNYCRDSSGKLWYVPGWYAQEMDDPWPGWAATSWWPRTDLVEKVGMKMEDLSTIEGVEAYLRAVKGLKDANGNAIIPLGFELNEGNTLNGEENIILSAFGVETASGNSKMPGIRKSGDDFLFAYDDPNFKNAYAWMNRMYRDGLIDVEVPTQKVERYREKVNAGQYGMIAGSLWKAELNNSWAKLDGPTDPVWFLQPMKSPKVEGVTETGSTQYVNPYPSAAIFISRNTKHLDAILKYLDWCQAPDPMRQQEVSEGPVGKNWYWTGDAYGEWDFETEYGKERNSGDQARVDQLTPQMWYLSTYSKKWYPWWTNKIGDDSPSGMKLATQYTSQIANDFGIVRQMHAYDAVSALSGGAVEKYLPTLDSVYIEYRARLLMAKSDEEFESVWKTFQEQLETRAHWSEMKAEWKTQYDAYLKSNMDF